MQVSIVIVNHNYEQFICCAIDSALAQQRKAQVVVVDDGSTDGSRALIEGYGDKIISVFKMVEGHVSAVNAGFAASTGDICIFLDSDDILYPVCVETVLRVWRKQDVKVQYRLDTIDRIGIDQRMPFPHFPNNLTPEEVRSQAIRYGAYPWTVSSGNAFARRFLDRLLPANTIEIYRSPDGYLNKLAPLFGDVHSITNILGAYRVHGSNAWAQFGSELDVDKIIRWLSFDQVLHTCFEREAERQSISVVAFGEVATVQQMEYRLLAFRFAPERFKMPEATATSLLLQGIAAIKIAPNVSLVGRVAWIAWVFVMAYMPKFTVRAFFRVARAQTGRSKLSRIVVAMARGRSRSKVS